MSKSFFAFQAIIEREFARFVHQRTRLLSAVVRPLFWLLVFAAGFKSTLGIAIQTPYSTYTTYDVYIIPGLVGMVCLFNGMQSSLAMAFDREAGSMKVLMTAPVSRRQLLIFKLLSAAAVSTIQSYLMLAIALLVGVNIPFDGLLAALPIIFMAAYALALIGLLLASTVSGMENFAGVMNFVIFPALFLSSSLYPLWQLEESSELLYWISAFNPFTYLVESIRFALYLQFQLFVLGGILLGVVVLSYLAPLVYKPNA